MFEKYKINAHYFLHNLQTVLLISTLFLLIIGGILFSCYQLSDQQAKQLSAQVLRFHVLADSDSPKDQQIKLELRSYLLDQLKPYLDSCSNVHEAKDWVKNHLILIESTANSYMKEQGLDKPVSAVYTNCSFPVKTYGNYTFPPGRYDALQIRIGQAAGHNWWCVLYPTLCFTDETTAYFPEDSLSILENSVSQESCDVISGPVEIRWKAAEFFQALLGG